MQRYKLYRLISRNIFPRLSFQFYSFQGVQALSLGEMYLWHSHGLVPRGFKSYTRSFPSVKLDESCI